MQSTNFIVGTSTEHPNNQKIFGVRLHKSFEKCPSFIEKK